MSLLALAARPKQASAIAATASATASAASSADKTTISQAARDLLGAQSRSDAAPVDSAQAEFDTDKGSMPLDIDGYFSPHASVNGTLSSLPPLLLPTQKNIDALTRHISATFPQFLKQNHIPYPPSSVSYDTAGKIQLPPDYPYAKEFTQALANSPALAREMSTVNAITSHLVEMNKSIPFQQEYSAATSQAEIDAIVAKYSYLFASNRHYASIALHFSASGSLSLSADGKPLA